MHLYQLFLYSVVSLKTHFEDDEKFTKVYLCLDLGVHLSKVNCKISFQAVMKGLKIYNKNNTTIS